MNLNKFTKLWCLLLMVPLVFLTSCGDDDSPEPAGDAVASFQFAVSEANFLEVTFTNFSENAATNSWDFGDGNSSTDESPVHTYAATGTYTVELTATNADGESATKSESITITDPNEALKLLTGEVSKTWKLFREGTSLSLGPDASNPAGWWAGLQNEGARPCLYDQTFTYHLDGTFVYDDMGMFWGENDPFNGTANHETCFEPTAANMVNLDGADVSAWASGTHAFTYDPTTGVVNLTGMGAWMGFVHTVGNATYSNVPTASRSFDIAITQETGYDKMVLTYDFADGGLWTAVYVSYSDASLEPAVVTEQEEFCTELDDLDVTTMGHTFASADGADQLGTFVGNSTIELGVDDPTDAAAAKVGKFTRVTTEQYQEAQLRVSPDLMDFDLSAMTKVSLEVFLPSSNDYTGDLSKVIAVGLADQSCVEEWWTDINQWVTDGTSAEDTWITLEYMLDDADAGSPKDRAGLDMFFINIGGGGHVVGGTFYVRNLKFE